MLYWTCVVKIYRNNVNKCPFHVIFFDTIVKKSNISISIYIDKISNRNTIIFAIHMPRMRFSNHIDTQQWWTFIELIRWIWYVFDTFCHILCAISWYQYIDNYNQKSISYTNVDISNNTHTHFEHIGKPNPSNHVACVASHTQTVCLPFRPQRSPCSAMSISRRPKPCWLMLRTQKSLLSRLFFWHFSRGDTSSSSDELPVYEAAKTERKHKIKSQR